MAGVETHGAVLFADLTGYSRVACRLDAMECVYFANRFFAWFQAEALRRHGGIVDKYIGDEVMVVFPHSECSIEPIRAAMRAARSMLGFDFYDYQPKIGVATGPFAIALVGTEATHSPSAMGETVNVAARCAATTDSCCVGIATDDRRIVSEEFDDATWDVTGPHEVELKNMGRRDIVVARRVTEWIPQFDVLQQVKDAVSAARRQGYVQTDG